MKKLLLFFSLIFSAQAADIKISQLPLGSASLTGSNDSFPYVDATSNVTRRLKLWDLINLPTVLDISHGGTGQTSRAYALNALLPSQIGESGKCLYTDGSTGFWGACGSVFSVFGRTGDVVAESGDYTTDLVTEASNLYFTQARSRASISGIDPIQYSSSTGIISITQSSGSTNGYLSSADWTTFNSKQAAGNYITALTGDVTASGPGSSAATLATVNASPGTFTYATITVNAKGLVTSASSGSAPEVPLTFSTGLTRNVNTITANLSTGIASASQTAIGSTSSAGNLILQSTSNSTKGYVGIIDAPRSIANYGLLSLGSGPFDGSTSGFFAGSASGTVIAVNAGSGFSGDLLNLTVAGAANPSQFKVTSAGVATFQGVSTISTDAGKNNMTYASGASGIGMVFTSGNLGYAFKSNQTGNTILTVQGSGTGAVPNNEAVGINVTTGLSALTVQPVANFTATGTATASGTSITGTGTKFTRELAIGDLIALSSASSTFAYVTAIASDTSITTNPALTGTANTVTVKKSILGIKNSAGTQQWTIDANGTLQSGSTFPTQSLNSSTASITTAGAANFQSIQAITYRLSNIVNGGGNSTIAGGNGTGAAINLQNSASESFTITTQLNTTGNPTIILNSRPNSTEDLFQLQKSGVAQITVDTNGKATFAGSATVSGTFLASGLVQLNNNNSTIQGGGNGSTTFLSANGSTGAGISRWLFAPNGASSSALAQSGTWNTFSISDNFVPTAGTAIFNGINLALTVNQTGGANGITRGLYINPTITAASNFKAIEVVSGGVYLAPGSSTAGRAPLYFQSGTNLTTASAGAMEYDGTNLFFTRTGTTRESVFTGNTASAPSTSVGVAIANYYGSSATNFLGDPAAWASVVIGGTTYKIPLYNP